MRSRVRKQRRSSTELDLAPPLASTQRQVVALSGEVYREFVAAMEENPGGPRRWEYFDSWLKHSWHLFVPKAGFDTPSGTSPDTPLGILAGVLLRHGLVIDQESRQRFFHEAGRTRARRPLG